MNIQYGHWHIIINLFKHEKHDSIAYLKLVEILIPQHIQHLVAAKVPHSEALVDAMLRHDFAIEVINFNKIGILKSEVFEKSPSSSVATLQVFK